MCVFGGVWVCVLGENVGEKREGKDERKRQPQREERASVYTYK
jgi:hypothetical protein